MLNTAFSVFKDRALSERIVMGLSALLFLFVLPITFYRLAIFDWAVFFLDLFLVSSAAVIFVSAYQQKFIKFAQTYMCFLVTIGASLSIILAGAPQVYWIYPTSLTMFFLTSTRSAYLFVFLLCALIAPTLWNSLQTLEFINVFIALFGTTAFINVFAGEIKQENKTLDLMANQDFLTGCGNRRNFELEADNQITTAPTELPPILIVLDIDNFKKLNDSFGHAVGDIVLQDLTKITKSNLRKTDRVFRLGGEEFAIILPHSSVADGYRLAEKIRSEISKHKSDEHPQFTVSMGVAKLLQDDTVKSWLERADLAMYKAKNIGKNKVVIE